MVELPEAYVFADQINKELRGKKIRRAEADHSPHAFAWYTGNPAEYNEKLAGKTITGADIYNGNVRVRAEDMLLIISTPIRFHKKEEKLPPKHQLHIEFEDSSSITCAVQMWGCMFCFREGDVNGTPEQYVVNTDPSPMEEGFDEEFFQALLHKEKLSSLSAKAFLTTQQRIPGLGNGTAQDILFTAKIHPRRKMSALPEAELKALFEAVKGVLTDMRLKGGRDTEYDLFGNRGGYKTILSKNTVNKPCPVCGTLIKKEAYLGGSIYFCESCQKE
jgi:formamidopyrimidine-DNA glycosylase